MEHILLGIFISYRRSIFVQAIMFTCIVRTFPDMKTLGRFPVLLEYILKTNRFKYVTTALAKNENLFSFFARLRL